MGRNKVSISVAADTAKAKQNLNSFAKEINNSKRTVRDLTAAYEQLDDATKKSSVGQQMQKDLQSAIDRYKELEKIQNQINRNLGKVPTNNLSSLNSSMSALTDTADAFGSKFGLSTATLSKMASPAGMAVAAAGAVGTALYTAEKHAIEFEDALSNLSAITGATGKDLDTLKDRIISTGKETHTSFKTIADAYTVVGSKMPALLQNQEGLDAVTRSIITLKKASRMSLEDATNSLTGIMNQMGASFFEADNYINVLAAGSKNGAGDIKYLATAFDQCGTAVSTAGLSIQQGTALIEMLAEKQPSASTAGVQLRNVLVKLTTASDEYNPKVVGLTKALQNLSNKTGDTSFMVKMFGAENMAAAIQLANNTTTVENLTKAVTDTEEAHKQAAKQTDNVASAARALKQDWDNFATAITSSSGPIQTAIRGILGGLGEIVKLMNYLAGGKTEKEISFDANTDKIKNRARIAAEKASKKGETSAQKQLRYAKELTKEINKQKKFRDAAIKNGESKENIDLRNRQINKLAYERQKAKEGKLNIFNAQQNAKPEPPETKTPKYKPTKSNNTTNIPKRDPIEEANKSYNQTMTELNGLLKDSMITQKEYDEKKKSAMESLQRAYYKEGKTVDISPELVALKDKLGKVKESINNDDINEADKELSSSIKEATDQYNNNLTSKETYDNAIIDAEKKYIEKLLKLGNLTDEQNKNLQSVKSDLEAAQQSKNNETFRKEWDDISKGQKSQTIELKYKFTQDKKSNRDTFNDLVDEYNEKKRKLDEAINDQEHPISYKLQIESQSELDKLEQNIDKVSKKVQKEVNFDNVFNTFGDLGNIATNIDSIGSAFENVKNPLQAFAATMHTITSLMQTYKTITELVTTAQNLFATSTTAAAAADTAATTVETANSAAKTSAASGEAIANATASGAKMPFPANIAAIAAGVAAVIAALAAVSGAFATGGVVGGSGASTTMGDNTLIRVNRGEMVLNNRQQSRLFKMLDGGLSLNTTTTGGSVDFKISGSNLYGSLKNYSNMSRKHGKITGIE